MATTYRDNGQTLFSGTEAERLAYTIETSDTYEKNVFWIEPNGNEFRVIEGAWVKIKAAGAALTSAVSSTGVEQTLTGTSADTNVTNFSSIPWPSTVSLSDSNATVADAEVLATLSNSKSYNMLTIVVSTFTATALNITVSVDGTNFSVALPSKDNENNAGAAIAAVGTYYLFGSFDTVVLTQSGAGGVTAQYQQWTK